MIAIDKNIPVPGEKFPLSQMEVGDSFFAAGENASSFGAYFSKQKPKKFTTRTVTESGVKGYRVWRIK